MLLMDKVNVRRRRSEGVAAEITASYDI